MAKNNVQKNALEDISSLKEEITNLKKRMQKIEQKTFVHDTAITSVWDNEYDERWDDC